MCASCTSYDCWAREHYGNVRVSSGWKVEDTFAKNNPILLLFYGDIYAIFPIFICFYSELYFHAILPVKVNRIYNNLFLFYVYFEPILKQVRTEWCTLSLFLHLIVQYWKYNNYTKFTLRCQSFPWRPHFNNVLWKLFFQTATLLCPLRDMWCKTSESP